MSHKQFIQYVMVLAVICVNFIGLSKPQKYSNATTTTGSTAATSSTPAIPVLPSPATLTDLVSNSTVMSVVQIITPSETCKELIDRFATAISNFTDCSVTNSRPIHLCGWCVRQYTTVKEVYHEFFVTTDERGNPCQEYFTNLDRIEIVSGAYQYVDNLWVKARCDFCFQKFANGTLKPELTSEVKSFDALYNRTKACFDDGIRSNYTCKRCKGQYQNLNSFYIDLVEKYNHNMCMDMVDTMNTTRELWSDIFGCLPEKQLSLWLHLGMGFVASTPLLFYVLSYFLSPKQETRVYQQRRMAEVFASTSGTHARSPMPRPVS